MFSAERWRTEELQKEKPMWTAGERALDNAQEVRGTNHRASTSEVCFRDSGCGVGCQGAENVD